MKVKESYNTWADSYDEMINKTRDLEKQVFKEVVSKFQFDNVIELGCGTGKNTEFLSNYALEILAVDFSENMLKIAQKKVNKKNIKYIKLDLNCNWNLPDVYADLICCSLVLEHIQDLTFIFSEAYKKLKSNGKFYICELHPFKQYTGSKAKFKTDNSEISLQTFIHDVSEYINVAFQSGFALDELNEWFDIDSDKKFPRLISFVFTKT